MIWPPSDGVKKAVVIGPTELLPAGPRVRLRKALLGRLELEKATKTGLLIIGHPKSGNTWLRVQLSRLYQVRHGLPADLIVTSDELHRRDSRIPRICATNGWYSYEGTVGAALAVGAADNPVRTKAIVFLARNPLDIAVSWYLQVTKRQSRAKFELINAELARKIDRSTIDLWSFVRDSEIGLVSLIDFLNVWRERVAGLPNAIIVRYEDLRADPARELRRIGELMGEQFSDDEIAEAVQFGSFDNLKKLESERFFKGKGLNAAIAGDPSSVKVRRARVGGYREDLTAEQARELEAIVRDRLHPSFGYAPAPLEAGASPSAA